MCGIAGIISTDGTPLDDRALAAVEKMTSLLAHRGPDDSGVHVAKSHLAAFGHRRLSIIDLSENAHQPYERGNSMLAYNGEILNFGELSTKYYKQSESSDTALLSKLIRDKGLEMLSELQGFFAFAHWDDNNKELLLARDALGKKPLFFVQRNGLLAFASELRAIVASGIVPFELDEEALSLYLSFYSVPSPHTMIKGVRILRPGHHLRMSNGEIEVKEWWRLPEHQPIKGSREEIVHGVRDRFFSSVEARLISDVPLGLFHSGGLDSNAVLAAASEISTQKLSTFNVRFGKRDDEESSVARTSAAHYGSLHTELSITEENVSGLLRSFFYRMDSPTGDGLNSFIISHSLSRSRPDIKVVLSGVGGDELFLGYKKIRLAAQLQAISKLLHANKGSTWTSSKFRNMYSALTDPLRLRVLFREDELISLTDQPSRAEQIISRSHVGSESVTEHLQRLDIENYLPHTLLRDLDVMTMAHSQEARAPFLDRELVEYAWQIPLKEKLKGRAKQLIVDAIGGSLPAVVLQKKKTGFELPMSQWLKSGFLRSSLDQLAGGDLQLVRDGHLKQAGITVVANDLIAGKTHYMKAWSIIALEQWYRSFTSGKNYEDWCSEPWSA